MTNTLRIIVHPSTMGYTAQLFDQPTKWAASRHDPFTAAYKLGCSTWFGRINKRELTYDQLRSISVVYIGRGEYQVTKNYVASTIDHRKHHDRSKPQNR